MTILHNSALIFTMQRNKLSETWPIPIFCVLSFCRSLFMVSSSEKLFFQLFINTIWNLTIFIYLCNLNFYVRLSLVYFCSK